MRNLLLAATLSLTATAGLAQNTTPPPPPPPVEVVAATAGQPVVRQWLIPGMILALFFLAQVHD